jgi:hypothetical protein
VIGRGERIESSAHFPNGTVLTYALSASTVPEITASFAGNCIEVQLPRQVATEWALGGDVSLAAELRTANDSFSLLVEKDLPCLHPLTTSPLEHP